MIRKARKVAAVVGRVVAAKAAVMAVATGEARVAVMEAERVVAMGAVMEAERVVAMEAERVVAMAAAMAVGMAVATGEKTAEVARAVVAGPMRHPLNRDSHCLFASSQFGHGAWPFLRPKLRFHQRARDIQHHL